jgi:dihydropteroate synthase
MGAEPWPAKRTLIMGILNVTPDSFSDGGRYASPEAAVGHARGMIEAGADIVDVGPESTRPGSAPVGAAEQIRRVVPVIRAIREHSAGVTISIDTRLASVAREALAAGANMINDISALRDDPEMADIAAQAGVPIVLMHMKGTPRDMQRGGGPAYDDVIAEVCTFLKERRAFAVSCGIEPSRIILDPGIGFGKRYEHNLMILRHLDRIVALGQPVLIGASRKAFIGRTLGIDEPADRDLASVVCALWALRAGARILRVHDVRATVQAVRMYHALEGRSDE